MSLRAQLDAVLLAAMKAGDRRTAEVVRMLKTRVTQRRDWARRPDVDQEALMRETIVDYRNQMQRALRVYASYGSAGEEHADQLVFEIAFCERYIPELLSETELRAVVAERAASLPSGPGRRVERLIAAVLETHADRVLPEDVRRVATEIVGS